MTKLKQYKWRLAFLAFVCVLLGGGSAFGARISDVRGTMHNLSSAADGSGTPSGGTVPARNIKATTEDQICVFCHTPHGATAGVLPLWNKTLSGAVYTPYTSSSLDAQTIKGAPLDQPGGSSKLCLSCHDGTLAIGNVNVLDGATNQSIAMNGGPNMPVGSGATTGYTRNLGINLTNDHPISVEYTTALAQRDGELRLVDADQKWPAGTGETIGVRSSGYKPKAPLERPSGGGTAQVQCATCHDPHTRETDTSVGNQKFLRLSRFQEQNPPSTNTFVAGSGGTTGDIVCLACHERGGASWAYSAHANPLVADETYTAGAATQREFPANLPVWKAACLNCHDTHTVQGSRRLLREGTDGAGAPKVGGNSAIEETCHQCHSSASTTITPLASVPAIKEDFALGITMPITNADQLVAAEVHDIGGSANDAALVEGGVDCTGANNKCGADFIEQRALLGMGNLANRHAECTDCHNPHRVVKFKDFRGFNGSGSLAGAPDSAGTHQHTNDGATQHSNIASGVLRGTYGVEPVNYPSNSFHDMPTSFDVKRGDPGSNTDTSVAASYVTREYQICLKCHSNFGFSDNNAYPTGNRPNLGNTGGGTPSGTNGLTQYTNQAKEFHAPLAHANEPLNLGTDGGAAAAYNNNNHRGWHPVMAPTGRTAAKRGLTATEAFELPWSNNVGTGTMYCTDCHGSNTAAATAIPTGSNPWGPHGSSNNFLLKGTWNSATGPGHQADGLCYKCHKYANYSGGGGGGTSSGFATNPGGNEHLRDDHRRQCSNCHVAVPHGWKNKQLLANVRDVGPEVGLPAGTIKNAPYTQAPYYMNTRLEVRRFAASGNWSADDCSGSCGM